MKQLTWPGIIAALLIALLALSATVARGQADPLQPAQDYWQADAAGLARQTLTPTPTRAHQRQPRATKAARATGTILPEPAATATPAAALLDPEAEEAVEAAPVTPGPMTSQILVFNPDTSGTATVLVNVLNVSGTSVFSTTLSLAPRAARLVALQGVGNGFQGGAVVSSDKNVQAMVVDANNSQTARDAYEGTGAPANTLTLPLFRHLAPNTQNSIVAIQNTSNDTANVTFTYFDQTGAQAGTQPLTIAPLTSAYVNTENLFPASQFVGSARITANKNIAAAEQSLYYQDTASFRALGAGDQGSPLYLPLVERKQNKKGAVVSWSETFVRNNGGAPTDITIEYYSKIGALLDSQTISGVAANGVAQFLSKDAGFQELGANYVGWAKVLSSGQPLALYSLEVQNRGKRLLGIHAIPDGQTGKRWVCGDTYRSSTQNSTLYLLNTHPSVNARVKVRVYDKNTGALLAVVPYTVPPNSLTAVALSESAYGGAGSAYQGMVTVTAIRTEAASKVIVMAHTPYLSSGKAISATAYSCSRF